MKTILRRHTTLSIILALITLFLIAGLLFLLRLVDQRLTKVLDIKEQIATYEINKKSFSEEAQEVKSLQARFEKLQGLVVTPANLPAVLSKIESLSKLQNLEFEITGVTTPVEEEKAKLRIDFTAVGSFSETSAFLDTLSHQTFATSFKRLEMVAVPKAEVVLTKDQKKPIVSKPSELKWRVFGTLEILSF